VLNHVAFVKRRITLGGINTRFAAAGHRKTRYLSRKLVDNSDSGVAFCTAHWGDKMVFRADFSGLFATYASSAGGRTPKTPRFIEETGGAPRNRGDDRKPQEKRREVA
jgi:hypothetical protein